MFKPGNTTIGSKLVRVGVLPGEGSGPEVVAAALQVLEATATTFGFELRTNIGGAVGMTAKHQCNRYLSEEVSEFCGTLFEIVGAILAGAAGGRFVYDLRKQFQLYVKLNPLRSYPELSHVCRVKLPARPVDILLLRENLQDLYGGDSVELQSDSGREVLHTLLHSESHVRAVIDKAVVAAVARRGDLCVISKACGAPAIHSLWHDCASDAAAAAGVDLHFADVDYAAYRLIHDPEAFDVIVAPNCFADILSDVGGLLAGSRALTYGVSLSSRGDAVYQTNHGAAHDLAGTDTANPVGQIFAAAMMLEQTFQLPQPARAIEDAVRSLWRTGWRTQDLAEPGCRVVGTRQFGELVAQEVAALSCETCPATG